MSDWIEIKHGAIKYMPRESKDDTYIVVTVSNRVVFCKFYDGAFRSDEETILPEIVKAYMEFEIPTVILNRSVIDEF